jgi:hypothetical protein
MAIVFPSGEKSMLGPFTAQSVCSGPLSAGIRIRVFASRDLREAAINEIMNPLPERQISIVEQHFSRQDEDQVSRGPAPCIRGVVRLSFVSPAGIAMSRVPPAGVGHDTNSVGCHV